MKVNFHLHSRCSFDADYPLTDMCAAAVQNGIGALCLTDHCDLLDEFGKIGDSFSWAEEEKELSPARAAFPDLKIYKGSELGAALVRPERAEELLKEKDIDFVLGSMHNAHLREDFYHIHPKTKEECAPLLEAYLLDLLALSRTDYFDSLAHLTYPLRYLAVRAGLDLDLRPWDDLVDEILKTLVEKGKALELNTSGFRNCGGTPLPPEYILRRYRERGGELITIGTDAHEPGHMADGLDRGYALLASCGFRYVTIYEKRKPRQILPG